MWIDLPWNREIREKFIPPSAGGIGLGLGLGLGIIRDPIRTSDNATSARDRARNLRDHKPESGTPY